MAAESRVRFWRHCEWWDPEGTRGVSQLFIVQQNAQERQLKGRKMHLDLCMGRCQSVVSGFKCFVHANVEHHSREDMVNQGCSPHDVQEEEEEEREKRGKRGKEEDGGEIRGGAGFSSHWHTPKSLLLSAKPHLLSFHHLP